MCVEWVWVFSSYEVSCAEYIGNHNLTSFATNSAVSSNIG